MTMRPNEVQRFRRVPAGVVPTESSPRWLTLVLRCDRAGSAWFIGAGFFFAPLLLILDPWPVMVIIAWTVIALSGLWLGVLGVFIAIGLGRVLRAGETIPDSYWWQLLGYSGPPPHAR